MKKKAFPMIKEKNQGKFTNWVEKKYAWKVNLRCRFCGHEK